MQVRAPEQYEVYDQVLERDAIKCQFKSLHIDKEGALYVLGMSPFGLRAYVYAKCEKGQYSRTHSYGQFPFYASPIPEINYDKMPMHPKLRFAKCNGNTMILVDAAGEILTLVVKDNYSLNIKPGLHKASASAETKITHFKTTADGRIIAVLEQEDRFNVSIWRIPALGLGIKRQPFLNSHTTHALRLTPDFANALQEGMAPAELPSHLQTAYKNYLQHFAHAFQEEMASAELPSQLQTAYNNYLLQQIQLYKKQIQALISTGLQSPTQAGFKLIFDNDKRENAQHLVFLISQLTKAYNYVGEKHHALGYEKKLEHFNDFNVGLQFTTTEYSFLVGELSEKHFSTLVPDEISQPPRPV